MAKITYENKVALNQNSSIPDINKVNDTDMNMIKNVVNNNETKVLLAVSSSAPATCDTGDIYFNTTDNLIYTATATNTWGATGVAPTQNTIYIEFTNQTLYAYDGTTLVSVGGGSGETITQQPTAPENPEENDLWIDTANGNSLKRYNGTSWEFVSINSDAPIGTITPFAGATPPSDYLLCDGTAISRTTYSDLFAVIGTTYGSGDGSTTFNLPNLKGRVPVGLDGTDTDFDTIGETGGEKAHTHLLPLGADGNSIYANTTEQTTSLPVSAGKYTNWSGVTSTSINAISSKEASNLQPYIVVNYIIKATKTTPIQAEVVNTQSTSTTDAYSCDYINGKVLYENASGSNTNITLSDSVANYNYIEIFYRSNDNVYSSLKVDSPNTKLINLTAFYAGGADIYNNSCNYTINGTSITRGTGVNWYILSNTTVSSSNAYNIFITKVIGYGKKQTTTQSTRSLNTYSGDIEEKKDIVIDDGNK